MSSPLRGKSETLRFGYADPPYPGMSHFYVDHPDYAGEVDHGEQLCLAATRFQEQAGFSTQEVEMPDPESDMHPNHAAGVVRPVANGHRAECVCGWTSKVVRSVEAAEHEQWQHGTALALMERHV